MPAAERTLRETLIFFPNEGTATPLESARALIRHLGVARAEIGRDALTGNVETRLYYDPSIVDAARRFTDEQGILCEIHVR
jgi:hypothetical protein